MEERKIITTVKELKNVNSYYRRLIDLNNFILLPVAYYSEECGRKNLNVLNLDFYEINEKMESFRLNTEPYKIDAIKFGSPQLAVNQYIHLTFKNQVFKKLIQYNSNLIFHRGFYETDKDIIFAIKSKLDNGMDIRLTKKLNSKEFLKLISSINIKDSVNYEKIITTIKSVIDSNKLTIENAMDEINIQKLKIKETEKENEMIDKLLTDEDKLFMEIKSE